MHPSWCSAVRQYLPLCCDPCASPKFALVPLCAAPPKVSEEEGSYVLCFYRRFWQSFKEFFFTSHGFSRFNWHSFAQLIASRSLRQRYLAQKNFHYHNSADLNSDITFIYCWKEVNTHTHTHIHTHTHTHTHTYGGITFVYYIYYLNHLFCFLLCITGRKCLIVVIDSVVPKLHNQQLLYLLACSSSLHFASAINLLKLHFPIGFLIAPYSERDTR